MIMYQLSDFDFAIPQHLIAQRPVPNRSDSRLLVFKNHMTAPHHQMFKNLLDYLRAGDVLVLNNTKVMPARFFGKKMPTGGKVEILLSRVQPEGSWVALLASRRAPTAGTLIEISGTLSATVLSKIDDEPGAYRIHFNDDIYQHAEMLGQIPLPPYIARACDEQDQERYQTVYADPQQNQAVAAPTAGLHFDHDFLMKIQDKGIKIAKITLHVGPGTFLPLRTDNIDEHKMHAEPWLISTDAANTINEARNQGGRVIAVGTTAMRTLESAEVSEDGMIQPGSGLTRLFIRPGFRFKMVDGFVTNFHLPKTTLLLLVAAAIGRDRLLLAYKEAIEAQYRFFSYGDACLFDVMDFAK